MIKILIILSERNLYLSRNNNIINSFPVAIGKPSTPTPTGNFSILNKIKNPYNSALGTRWMQFTSRMHGIHGTNKPWLIGQAVSHGCVRMHNQNAEYVYKHVQIGTPVEIKNKRGNKQFNPNQYTYYTVKPNDTLYKIAKRFNTTVIELVQINKIKNKQYIYPGQKIKIPI